MEWVVLILLIILWRVHASRLNGLRAEVQKQDDIIRRLTGRVFELERGGVQPQRVESVQAIQAAPAAAPPEPSMPEVTSAAEEPTPEVYAIAAKTEYTPEPVETGPSIQEQLRDRFKGVEWEEMIGGSWLNALGILVLVIGISSALGLVFTQIGPAGKVAIGLGLSLAMLATGVFVERKERYAVMGRGLLAGGWAALYFTSYAMHAIAAARVIDSPLLGSALMLAVACGMIAHSLQYRSQNLTLLAYATAFFTLQLAEMSGFTIAACLPLSISLLTISRYLRWTNIPIAGMVLSYFTFAFRYDPKELSPALGAATLYSFWLAFEGHDLLKLRAGFERSVKEMTMFPLNAMLFIGTTFMSIPPSTPVNSAYFLGTCGIMFLISTILRMRWKAVFVPTDMPIVNALAQSHRIAISFAGSLFAGSLLRRFDASRSEVGLLMEAQLLVLAGLRFGDRFFCHVGAAVFGAAILNIALRDDQFGKLHLSSLTFSGGVPYAFWMAAQFYFNRWLTKQGRYYTWAALLMVMVASGEMTRNEWTGVIWVVLAVALMEVFLRTELFEFRYQAAVAGVGGFLVLWFPALAPESGKEMMQATAAGCGAALFYLVAFRLHRLGVESAFRDAATLLGTLLAAISLWHVLPAPLVAMGWGLLGLALLETGFAAGLIFSRWQAHALIFAALIRLFIANFAITSETAGISHRVLTVVPMLVLAWHAHRRSSSGTSTVDAFASRAYSWVGVIAAGSLIRFEFGRTFAVVGWASLMLVLLHFGLLRNNKDYLYQAYSLAALTFFRGWATNFSSNLIIAGLTIAAFHAAQFRTTREDTVPRNGFALMGSSLLSILLYYEISGSLLTIAWGIQGVAMLMAGFAARERILRLAGLGLFLLCVLKLFLYDLRNLDTLSRIVSFIVLGLVMMGASWLYMRFREKIQRYL